MTSTLRLAEDEVGILSCNERIQGYTPIFIPRKSALARSIIEHCHLQTLHGGVATTMNKVRQKYWIPKLRALLKSVRHKCNHCKKYRAKILSAPPTSALPRFRTEFTEPFNVTGVDFAGPLLHKSGNNGTSKAYITLFTCASTRAVHLKLCKDMRVMEVKQGFKEFVVRRGAPELIVRDNTKTFQAAKKRLSTLRKDEDLFNFLSAKEIEWKFNMSRALWRGGFFKRLIGITKSTLSTAIGRALLTFEEVLLDMESVLNNQPLSYLGEEFEMPVITPNLLFRWQPARFLEENGENMSEGEEMTRWLRYLKCRDNVRKRWLDEYLRALQERFNTHSTPTHEATITKGSLVLLKDTTKNKANWKIGRVVNPIVGRPLHLLCDLEISETSHDSGTSVEDAEHSSDIIETGANQRRPQRPEREARRTAMNRLVGVIANENEKD